MIEEISRIVDKMSHGALRNYVIPGLTSHLVGGDGHGTVRLFTCERDHQELITPHSHRFSFTCLVLQGAVRNRVWMKCRAAEGDAYQSMFLKYGGSCAEYREVVGEADDNHWKYVDMVYEVGMTYSMTYQEVHSIYFSRGAMVLFFEGPSLTDETQILQPLLESGEVVPTFKVEPWMFRKDAI